MGIIKKTKFAVNALAFIGRTLNLARKNAVKAFVGTIVISGAIALVANR